MKYYYVYILQSELDQNFYTGYTNKTKFNEFNRFAIIAGITSTENRVSAA